MREKISVTPAFKAAVADYQRQHNLSSWSQAVVELAAKQLNFTEKAAPEWGGNRRNLMLIHYYVQALCDFTVGEVERGEAGPVETIKVKTPVYPKNDANLDPICEADVQITQPVGYTLTDEDHARIDELIGDNWGQLPGVSRL
jgi:hypothetical protein